MSVRLDSDLTDRLRALVATHRVPGASAQITARGVTRRAVAGVEALSTGRPVGLRSRFGIGSISKIPTIAMTLSFMERAFIGVDTSLRTLLPELEFGQPGMADRITVWHLLTHSSGLQSDHFPELALSDDVLQRYLRTCTEVQALHEPGERFSYCNSGFIVLGAIAERLGGKPWPRLLREHVLHPLGMADTHLALNGDNEEPVRGHTVDPVTGELAEDPFWLPAPVGPAGLLCSTPENLTRFALAVLPGRGGPFGNAPGTMVGAGIPTPPGHGLVGSRQWRPGWAEWSLDGMTMLGYDGCIGTQCSAVRIIPEEDFVAVVMTNALEGEWVAAELIDHVLTESFGVCGPTLPRGAGEPHDPLPATAVYERDGARVVLEHDGEQPVLSLKFSGDIAGWTAQEFHRAPLRAAGGRRLWTVELDRGSRPVAFDGDLVGDAPKWLYFDLQAHRLRT